MHSTDRLPGLALTLLLYGAVAAQTPRLVGDLTVGSTRPVYDWLSVGQRTFFGVQARTEQVWCVDPAGVRRVLDFGPCFFGGRARMCALGGLAILPGCDARLYASDGTAAGTRELVRVRENPQDLFSFRGEVLFRVGGERWRTDGTVAGTRVDSRFAPRYLYHTPVGGSLYMADFRQLVVYDGVQAPRVVRSFAGDVVPRVAFQGRLVFSVFVGGVEHLWISGGTAATTVPLSGVPAHDPAVTESLLFYVADLGTANELRATDGTAGGDRLVRTFARGAWMLRPGQERVFFLALENGVTAIWVSDGTRGGTQSSGRLGHRFVPVGSRNAVFLASDPLHGQELWITDGSPGGTRRIADLWPGPESGVGPRQDVHYGNGRVFFWGNDGRVGLEPWSVHVGAGHHSVGVGCAPGLPPRLDADDLVLGGSLRLRGQFAPPGVAGLVAVGQPPLLGQRLGGGCTAHVDLGLPFATFPVSTTAQGAFRMPALAVPNLPALDGVRVAAQAVMPSPGSLGLSLSQGVVLVGGR